MGGRELPSGGVLLVTLRRDRDQRLAAADAVKPTTVHLIGNRSTFDSLGRMKRFLTQTMCGRLLAKPMLVTDDYQSVTCQSCRKWIERFGNRG